MNGIDDLEAPPQDPTDPGEALRRMAQKFGGPVSAAPGNPGDALRAMAQRFSAHPERLPDSNVGDIDLRDPADITPPVRSSRDVMSGLLNLTPATTTAPDSRAQVSPLSPLPRIPRAQADVTRVGAEPSAHYQPGTLERIATFPLSMAFGAAQHPVDFAMAPVKALGVLGQPSTHGTDELFRPGTDEPQPQGYAQPATGKEKAIAAAQVGATLLAPGISGKVAEVAEPLLGAAAGKLAGHMVAAGTAGAAFDPSDPVVGFFGASLMGLATPDAAAVAKRAVDAGSSKVAELVQAAHDADATAKAQGTAEARQQFNAIVARTLSTFTPSDLTHIQRDPILGPLSHDVLQQMGAARPEPPDLSAAQAELQRTPQTEPDRPLANLIRPPRPAPTETPAVEPAQVAPPVTPVTAPPDVPSVASRPGDALRALAQKYRDRSEQLQQQPASPMGTEATPTSAPPTYELRDLLGKNADEIERIANEETAREKNIVVDTFGPEGAKRYNAAQRTANNQYAGLTPDRERAANETIAQMEAGLTEAQRNRLFGIGEKGLNAEELRAAARAARDYAPENVSDMPEADLLSTVGRELTTGSPHRNAESALRLRGAAAELQRRSGRPFEDVLRQAIEERGRRGYLSSGEQGAELLGARLKDLRDAGLFTEHVEPTVAERQRLPAATGETPSPASAGDALRDLARKYVDQTPRPPIESIPGAETRVLLRDGQTLPAQYHIVSADELQSSHGPFSFQPNINYPEGVQGRDYQRNKAAQSVVSQRALAFNPDIALNPSESAGEGAPTILPDGTVLAGNERSMLPRRAMVQAPDKYQAYVDQLKARAQSFGLDPASVDATRNPMLVRVLTDPRDVQGGVSRWAEINRLSDEVGTKAKSGAEEGAARATKLAQASDALDHLSNTLQPEQTVSHYLGTPDGREFVRRLQSAGVITPDEMSRLTDASGALTEDGRLAVRRMLLSTAVTDPSAILDAPAGIVSKLEHAVPSIVATKGTKFDTAKLTTAALKMLAEARDNGLSVRELESQGALFGDVTRKPTVTALAAFLDEAKPSEVKAAFRRYATLARETLDNSQSSDLFGGTGYEKPIDAFNEAFGFSRRGAPVVGGTGGMLEARAPLTDVTSADAQARQLYAEIPVEQRSPAGHPTRAGELLAEARTPRETSAGPALGSPREAPTPDVAVRGVNRFVDSLRKIFSPTSRGPEAFATGLTVREHDAALVHRFEQAKAALMDFARTMDHLSVATQLDFIDRLEHGRAQATPELTKLSGTIRSLLDSARDEIRALGDGQLEHWIEHYFPHIWADPERARNVIASIMGKRSLTGPGSFLKRRSIPTIAEGIEAGLTPLTFNPIDLTLLKLQEMHRYLAGQRILTELKGDGRLRFVNSFSKAPLGMEMINDKLSTVYGPPKVSVVEAFDHMVRTQLEDVMREMGVRHERRANIGGGRSGGVRLGFAEGASHITTRSATPESVIEHEFGHALDAKLNLWQSLHDAGGNPKSKEAVAYRKAITVELRNLADLRHEGVENVDPEFHKYVRSREEKVANAVMGLIYAPERMREVAPTVYSRLREILNSDPTTAKILDIKPSFRHGADTFDVKTPGQVILGHWYAPEPVARVVNNYLSPGLSQSAIGPYFDIYRGAGNLLNMAQLGLSAYHLGFTSLDAIVSKNALGLLQLREGHPLQAASSFATSLGAPITGAMKGFRVKQAYLRGTTDPMLAQIIDGLEAAGGRVKMDEFYGGNAWRQAKLALHEGRYGAGIAKLVPAAIEQSTAWLMQHVVPWQKLGVFYDLAQHEMAKLPPGSDRMAVRHVMARAWDSVENRMGQLTYNNLFWHRWLKDGLMASVRSVGWNLGTMREIPGGLFDLARSPLPDASGRRFALTPKASYVVALPVTVALMGGVLHYLYTGQVPDQLKDWFYPRTGRKNTDGSDERVQLPSYMRDVFDYTHAPGRTVLNKLNPLGSALADMLANRDFYGNEIRNPDDPAVRQLAQEARFVASQFAPFGARNMATQLHQGQSLGTASQNLIGITPAPRAVVRSVAQNRMTEFLARRSGGAATPEEVEQRGQLRDLKSGLRHGIAGDSTAAGDALRQLAAQYAGGTVSRRQAQQTIAAGRVSPDVEQYKRLTAEEAIAVYQLATPAERQHWQPYLLQKLRNARQAGHHVAVPAGILP